jgi:polysaccharide biosynthesis/export protein
MMGAGRWVLMLFVESLMQHTNKYPALFMIQILRFRVRLAMVLAPLMMACSPATIQTSPQTAQLAKSTESSASEINKVLAEIALQTSLPLGDYQIGPEDMLQITLYNIQETEVRTGTVASGGVTPRNTAVRVSQQGLISLPLIGDVRVAGLTPAGLERELKNQYDKYIYGPQVGVLVLEYRQRVSVIGAVQKSGVFELSGPKTVIEILGMAGGVSEKAGNQVHIYRQGANGRESHVIDLLFLASNATLINANNASLITMPVQAGDVINVPPAGTFFIDGAVKTPGPYPLGRRYSLTQALATAGGLDRDLYSSNVSIFRRKGSAEMANIAVDLDDVFAGSAVDPLIEADDVIVVPMSTGKYLVKRFVGTMVHGISVGSFWGK